MTRANEAKKHEAPAPDGMRRSSGRSVRERKRGRKTIDQENAGRYWMRCPRCGLGLIETVSGAVSMERCTACGRIWQEPRDLIQLSQWDTTGLFRPFREE